ncbi:MAG: ribonuclease HI [Novosphingobium sp.]
MKPIEMFTDGACKGNPGPGGWGAILRIEQDGKVTEKELSGNEPQTTNNRMELMAVMKGLAALKAPCHVKLHTDSRYVIDGITKWVFGWHKNGWRTADKKPVKNEDLWRELVLITKPHRIDWIWVKGHDGHIENERVDKLASDAALAVVR